MPDTQFTVPYPEHTHFVGREDDLARLHAALQGEGPVGINYEELSPQLGLAALDAPITCLAIAPSQLPLVVTGDTAGNVYCLEWVE